MKFRVWYQWIIGILGLSTVVIAHEMGHFLICKLFHVATPLFSIGFGPRLWAFTIKSTTFQLAAFPLGGYVTIDPLSFASQPYGVKMLIMVAGIIFNFLFAFVAFLYLMYISKSPIAYQFASAQSTSQPLLNHTPSESLSPTDNVQSTDASPPEEFNPPESLYTESAHPKTEAHLSPINRLKLLQRATAQLFTQEGAGGIVGPIGIISLTGKSLSYGKDLFIFTLALLSINIGIFNLLPIPGLDGSQLLMLSIEKVVGPLPDSGNWIHLLIFILLTMFMLFITFSDIKRLNK